MSYDIAFRHQQALDTSALTTLLGALHGLQAAIEDTRRAGKQPDSDPAVILLARHLGAIANSQGESDSTLKRILPAKAAVGFVRAPQCRWHQLMRDESTAW